VVRSYLPRSATFIHTVLRFQRDFRPVVLARRAVNVAEFPVADFRHLTPVDTAPRRAWRRGAALASGYRTTYSHRITKTAAETSCVALHAHFGWAGVAAVPAAVRTGLPLVTSFYGLDLSQAARGGGRSRPHRRLFAEGTLFVCEGPVMARHLAELGGPPARIRIVKIGIDLDQWPFSPPRRTRPLIIVQTSRFVEKKGIDLSLRAFAAAKSRLGPSELWVVGDGPLREDMERLAARLGIAGHVRFLGMLAYEEYREVMRRAHICIQPSRTARDGDTEGGAPTVLLEMQAAGIAVVATRHADIPFVVHDPDELAEEEDVDGIADALVRKAGASEDEWAESSARGRALVEERHDARVLAGEIAEVYREALRLANGRAAA
jgi:colanic acid/amylovoran biosynthesis glycosyltransferase